MNSRALPKIMNLSLVRPPLLRLSLVLSTRQRHPDKILLRCLSTETKNQPGKLMYEGKLSKRVTALKSVSYVTSTIILGTYSYAIASKGFGTTLAASGLIFAPFIVSPIVIAWMFKRYVTVMYYNEDEDTFTLKHCGLFLNHKTLTFKASEVAKADAASVLNTFEVKGKAFFLNDEDLIDSESVQLYKKMLSIS